MEKIIIKITFMMAVLMIYDIIGISIGAVMENTLGMNQMDNLLESSALIQVYTYFKHYGFVLIVLAAFIIFRKELSLLFTKINHKKGE